jgi:hypothetical protein
MKTAVEPKRIEAPVPMSTVHYFDGGGWRDGCTHDRRGKGPLDLPPDRPGDDPFIAEIPTTSTCLECALGSARISRHPHPVPSETGVDRYQRVAPGQWEFIKPKPPEPAWRELR